MSKINPREGLIYFPSVAKAMKASEFDPGAWPLKHFAPKEVACKSSDEILLDLRFGKFMDDLRDYLGKPLKVSSWYRTPEHNIRVSTSGSKGPHTSGAAADLKVYGDDAVKVIHYAVHRGIKRIGVNQRGAQRSRFIHLDMDRNQADAIWSY